jgi:hypothetical protein
MSNRHLIDGPGRTGRRLKSIKSTRWLFSTLTTLTTSLRRDWATSEDKILALYARRLSTHDIDGAIVDL